MADYKNIPLGLRTQTQIPLDVKEYIQNESLLSNLGVNGQLAYTYTKGLVVYCIEESTRWEWTEVKPGLEDTGLINQDFIYPDNHVAFGMDYSNKRYNFFPYNQSTFTVPDATTTIKGILKLANDLGGTADAPTTPTALHKTGNETFTGNKSGSNTSATPTRLLINTSSDATLEGFLANTMSSTQPAIRITSSTVTGDGGGIASIIETFGYNAIGLKIEPVQNNPESGNMLVLSNKRASNNVIDIATPLSILRDGVEVAKISDIGDHTANKYIKTGGTSTQMLMADGSVKENQDNLQKVITTSTVILDIDNNNTIFINNGATPITITIDSSITLPNFCVGFIQEGTGDVTFVGTGVSLTNPVGLKSKGQGYATFIERKLATSTYFLLGNIKS